MQTNFSRDSRMCRGRVALYAGARYIIAGWLFSSARDARDEQGPKSAAMRRRRYDFSQTTERLFAIGGCSVSRGRVLRRVRERSVLSYSTSPAQEQGPRSTAMRRRRANISAEIYLTLCPGMLFLFHILIACAIFTHNNPTVFSNNMRSDLNR